MAKPRPEARRFLFDHNFDAARKPAKKLKPEDEKPPEPTFSRAQLDEARQQGYEQGRAAGVAEATAGAEAEIARLVAGVAEALPGVAAAQDEANGRLMHDGATLVAAIVRKILPSLVARNGLDEIDALLDRCLRTLIDQPKIIVRVAPSHVEELKARLAAAASASGFGGRFMIETDDGLGPSDCRVSWQSGGLERRSEDIWRQVETALDGYLGSPERPGAEAAEAPAEALDTSEER
jgi:flagellar assembly protein FliH